MMTSTTRIVASTSDEPIVPKSSPPFSSGFVSRSPNVAPKGRVSTNAIQNNVTRSMRVV